MQLEGIHHITAITAEAQRNVDFYAGTMGLRMVKKTVNQDEPSVYHLFYARRGGQSRRRPDLLRVPRHPPGPRRRGHGAHDRLAGGLRRRHSTSGSSGLPTPGPRPSAIGSTLRFADPEGLGHELEVVRRHRRTADRRPSGGPEGVRAAGLPRGPRVLVRARAQRGHPRRRAWASSAAGAAGRRAASERGGLWSYDPPPAERALQGAGTVHHIAWASTMEDHEAWRPAGGGGRRAADAGDRPVLVSLDLLPRAQRRPLRARDDGPRLRRRRGSRAPGREA